MADDSVQILATEDRRRGALVAVDLAELDALFAEDLVHVHSNAMVHDKTALLRHIETRRAFIAIERGRLDVRIYGDFAVMTGPMTNRMRTPDGTTVTLEGIVTQVLRRIDGAWRFTNFQFTLG